MLRVSGPTVTPLPHGVMRIENGGIDLWSASAKAKMDEAFIEQLGASPNRHQLQSLCEVGSDVPDPHE